MPHTLWDRILMTKSEPSIIERVEQVIFLVRGERVTLDADLASLYGVTTGRLNEQVKRNAGALSI